VGATPDRVDDQIEIDVSIDVHKSNSRRIQFTAPDARFVGNIFKFPTAQVAIESIRGIHSGKVQVTATVAVYIPGRNA
jgi:hypothetical protein